MRKEDKTYAEISKYVEDHYDEFLLDADLRKIYERTKPKTDLMLEFGRQFDELFPRAYKSGKKIALDSVNLDSAEKLTFKLKIV